MKFLKSDLYEQPSGGRLQKQGGKFETRQLSNLLLSGTGYNLQIVPV